MSQGKVKSIEECKVTFRDKSQLSFDDTINSKMSDITVPEFIECCVQLGERDLSFYLKKDDNKPFCRYISKPKITVNLDRNNQILTLSHLDNKYSILEIRTDVGKLEKIAKYCESKTQHASYRTPLSYTPCNKDRESIFSTGATTTNLRGFLNLALIALFFSKFKDIVKNFYTYGLKLGVGTIEINQLHLFVGLACLVVPLYTQFILEYFFMKKIFKPTWTLILTPINVAIALLAPIIFNQQFQPHVSKSFIKILTVVLIVNISGATMFVLLKIISYAHVNHHIRSVSSKAFKALQDNQDPVELLGEEILSSENWEIIKKHKSDLSGLIKISDYLYYLAAPTFCYQLYYPRNPKIRWNWLLKRVVEFICCIALMAFIAGQFLIPILSKTPQAIETGDPFQIVYAVINTSFPTTALWILMFFAMFHYYFNIVAELLRFSDRQFYLDWWNCRDMNEYWRLWNIPIHSFLTRHVYYPLLRRGYSKQSALMIVFLFSALGHEYWASVPLLHFTGYTTLFFAGQAPLMIFQKKLDKFMKGSQIGNVIFWCSFCFLGQPGGLVLLHYLYVTKNAA